MSECYCELCRLQEGLLKKIVCEYMPFVPEVAKHGVPKALNSFGGLIYICGTCEMELEARKQIAKNEQAILIKEQERGESV